MNCAIPCARRPLRVTGPTASDRNRLSCQITRAKNSSGRSFAVAADSIIKQIASRVLLSAAPSPPLWATPAGMARSFTLGLATPTTVGEVSWAIAGLSQTSIRRMATPARKALALRDAFWISDQAILDTRNPWSSYFDRRESKRRGSAKHHGNAGRNHWFLARG